MSFLDIFKKEKKKNKLPEDVEEIFEKVTDLERAKAIVDKAVSFRTLGEYDKAINILKEGIRKYPSYKPARLILGVTLIKKGDIVEAENYLKKILSEHATNREFQLTEVYANLGSIRWKHYNDFEGALKYYDLALKEPKTDPSLDDKGFEYMKSNVYRDLCWLHFGQENLLLAKRYAAKRFNVVRDCPIASKVLGICILKEYMVDYKNLEYVANDTEPTDLLIAAECFRNCLAEDENDYFALYGISLSCAYLTACTWVINRPDMFETIQSNWKQVQNNFYYYAQKDEEAKKLKDEYEKNLAAFPNQLKMITGE